MIIKIASSNKNKHLIVITKYFYRKGTLAMSRFTQIVFKVKRETGVVSFLMLNARKFDLLYTKKYEREDGNNSHVVIYYTGVSDTNEDEIKESFLAHPGVLEIEDVSVVSRADMRKMPRPDVVAA